jgi:hypothetical protein
MTELDDAQKWLADQTDRDWLEDDDYEPRPRPETVSELDDNARTFAELAIRCGKTAAFLEEVREEAIDVAEHAYKIGYRAGQAASAERIKALEHDLMWTDRAWEAAQEAVVYGYTLMDRQDARIKALEHIAGAAQQRANDHGEQLLDAYERIKALDEDVKAALLEGIRLGLEAAATAIDRECPEVPTEIIGDLDPATIAREAVLDNLASEAQEQGMGHDRKVRYSVKVVRPPSAPLIAKEADQ